MDYELSPIFYSELSSSEVNLEKIRESLKLGELFFEKGALQDAKKRFEDALEIATLQEDSWAMAEALNGLVRLADEALDRDAVQEYQAKLHGLTRIHDGNPPPMVWYLRGAIAWNQQDYVQAGQYFSRCLKAARHQEFPKASAHLLTRDDMIGRAWGMIAFCFFNQGKVKRAHWAAERILHRYEGTSITRIKGTAYLLLAKVEEKEGRLEESYKLFQKAHITYIGEHNWYWHLYALLGYARIARVRQQEDQAYWYLNLVDQACQSSEFKALRQEVLRERERLAAASIDLEVDPAHLQVRLKGGEPISLRKQHILMLILEALVKAHEKGGDFLERGLSKGEIVEYVWRVPYRAEAHDNKLYYNINRLRKLVEPDFHQPQIILNSREGYRISPTLRVQLKGNIADREGPVVSGLTRKRPQSKSDLPKSSRSRLSGAGGGK